MSIPNRFRVLFFGDVYAAPGRRAIFDHIERLKRELAPDLIVMNGENVAGGFGITKRMASSFFRVGVDVITSGNHIWDRPESVESLEDPRVLRPANYPPQNPGSGVYRIKREDGVGIAVINLQGRVFMDPIDCPFRTLDAILEELGEEYPIRILDFHAEATAEKKAMLFYAKGRLSAIIGTHTHVQTADEQILDGTAYITDAGMVGIPDSVIGVKPEGAIKRLLLGRAQRFEPQKEGEVHICGVVVDIDPSSGKALSIKRLRENFPSAQSSGY